MRWHLFILKNCVVAALGAMSNSQPALAAPIWHCSRSEIQIADASDNFTLASLAFEREVIRLSLRDLYAVYQGAHVRLTGGIPLSACVIGDHDSSLTKIALQSIGSPSGTMKALSSQSAITKSNIHVVHSESAMLTCITKHHPALVYLSEATDTETVGPCF